MIFTKNTSDCCKCASESHKNVPASQLSDCSSATMALSSVRDAEIAANIYMPMAIFPCICRSILSHGATISSTEET